MLVLTRKINQAIMIKSPQGGEIEVTVVEIRGADQVRLGVNAPRDVAVDRTEIRERKQQGEVKQPGDKQ